MKHTFEKYREKNVRLICIPLPPTPVSGLIYLPDSFTGKTFDKVFSRSAPFNVKAIEPTPLGPAILAWVRLKDLISYDEDGQLTVTHSTCCASVSYRGFESDEREGAREYAFDVDLDGLSMTSGSCHPGSHYVVPGAPYLSAFLQYAQAPGNGNRSDRGIRTRSDMQISYLTPDAGKLVFPYCDFTRNEEVDKYIRKCTVDLSVSYGKILGGLGRWSMPLLKDMRWNRVKMGDMDYEQYTIVRPDEESGHARQEDDSQDGGSPECSGDPGAVLGERREDPDQRSGETGDVGLGTSGNQGDWGTEARSESGSEALEA
jgi:hypothetical protein